MSACGLIFTVAAAAVIGAAPAPAGARDVHLRTARQRLRRRRPRRGRGRALDLPGRRPAARPRPHLRLLLPRGGQRHRGRARGHRGLPAARIRPAGGPRGSHRPRRHRRDVLGGQPQPDLGFHPRRRGDPLRGAGRDLRRRETTTFGFTSDENDVGANVLAGLRIQDRFYVEAKQEFGRRRAVRALRRGPGSSRGWRWRGALEIAFPQVRPRLRHHHAAQREQRDQVRDRHQAVRDVGEGPDGGQRRPPSRPSPRPPTARGRASPRARRTGTRPPSRRSTTSRGWSRTRR